MNRSRITDDMFARIPALLLEGTTKAEIAAMYGVTPGTLVVSQLWPNDDHIGRELAKRLPACSDRSARAQKNAQTTRVRNDRPSWTIDRRRVVSTRHDDNLWPRQPPQH
jgi:hypothetical protein